ncbi:conserved hypothetical protein [Novosphingobium sp. 9U]|nr:conserved hypothetical protein [Novosphingobium sp. 9U]
MFTRQALADNQLNIILAQTRSRSLAARRRLALELKRLHDVGMLERLDRGSFRLRDMDWANGAGVSRKGVLLVDPQAVAQDNLKQWYRFDALWLDQMGELVGNWIIFQHCDRKQPGAYFATAKVLKIVPESIVGDVHMALLESGSFRTFLAVVPYRRDQRPVERGLDYGSGRLNTARALEPVRPISEDDYRRIDSLGQAQGDLTFVQPRSAPDYRMRGDREDWDGRVERAAEIVSRPRRDGRLRQVMLHAYNRTCAFTGLRWGVAGGAAEVQVAHVRSVEANGPNEIWNVLGLSSSMHWLFDTGLLSMSDTGRILFSDHLEDRARLAALIFPDRQARLPVNPEWRPDPRCLAWHREHVFRG